MLLGMVCTDKMQIVAHTNEIGDMRVPGNVKTCVYKKQNSLNIL